MTGYPQSNNFRHCVGGNLEESLGNSIQESRVFDSWGTKFAKQKSAKSFCGVISIFLHSSEREGVKIAR